MSAPWGSDMNSQLVKGMQEDAVVAERLLLGAVLTSPGAYTRVFGKVSQEMFFLIRHRLIWSAVERAASSHMNYGIDIVAYQLRAFGREAEVGGLAFLLELAAEASSEHAEIYAALVAAAHTRRRLLQALDQSYAALADPERGTDDVLAEIERAVFSVRSQQDVEMAAGDAAAAWLEKSGGENVVMTGFASLDALLGGLRPGQNVVVGAATSMGKTAFLLSVALNAARAGKRVWIWSGEMTAQEIAARLLAMLSDVNLHDIVRRRAQQQQMLALQSALQTLRKLNIVVDASALSLAQLHARVRRRAALGVDLVVVDYLGLLHVPEQRDRRLQLSAASWLCKQIAMEIGAPVLAASQLSRDFVRQADKRPGLHDFKESGDIENNADVALGLYRDAVYNPDTANASVAELLVLKQRNGPRGKVYLYFDLERAHFKGELNVRRVDLKRKENSNED